jgi:hypothetical protein
MAGSNNDINVLHRLTRGLLDNVHGLRVLGEKWCVDGFVDW